MDVQACVSLGCWRRGLAQIFWPYGSTNSKTVLPEPSDIRTFRRIFKNAELMVIQNTSSNSMKIVDWAAWNNQHRPVQTACGGS